MKLQILPRSDVGNFQRREFRSHVRQAFQLIRSQRAVADFSADHVPVGCAANAVHAVFQPETFKVVGVALTVLQCSDFLLEAL